MAETAAKIEVEGGPYTLAATIHLMDQVALYDPFKRGHSWPGLKRWLGPDAVLKDRSDKSMRDRALLSMAQRAKVVSRQKAASGIEVPPPTELELAIDEALLLKKEAEEETAPAAKLQKVGAADDAIIRAAMRGPILQVQGTPPKEGEVQATKTRAKKVDLGTIIQGRTEFLKEVEARRIEEAREDRRIQERKLALEERALALREREAVAAVEERKAFMQFLMRQADKN